MALTVELADPDRGWYRALEGSARAIGVESKLGTTRKIVNRTVSSMVATLLDVADGSQTVAQDVEEEGS